MLISIPYRSIGRLGSTALKANFSCAPRGPREFLTDDTDPLALSPRKECLERSRVVIFAGGFRAFKVGKSFG